MNRKMIGEAIYIRVSDRKYNPIATKRGNVPTQSCRSKTAVFRMYSMWPKVLPHVKKNPYIINPNHIFSKHYCEVISG
jgi:hypothetical protein